MSFACFADGSQIKGHKRSGSSGNRITALELAKLQDAPVKQEFKVSSLQFMQEQLKINELYIDELLGTSKKFEPKQAVQLNLT